MNVPKGVATSNFYLLQPSVNIVALATIVAKLVAKATSFARSILRLISPFFRPANRLCGPRNISSVSHELFEKDPDCESASIPDQRYF
jgi:hypothetical protein